MWVARAADGAIVGTAALVQLTPEHEELKSMRTDPTRRRAGIARRMLDFVLADASARGVRQISLETGSMTFFAPARALYSSAGFNECPPFGGYRDDPNSTYMTRAI
jgi:putative acetyltransferase